MNLELMLDSGAFTAYRQGETIDVKEYARFVLDNPGVFNVVANLDVIPISTSRLIGQNGAVLIPPGVLGPRHRQIVFSDDPRVMHSRTADHFRALADVERTPVLRYLESYGMTPDMLAEYEQRDVMNARFFLEYERTRDVPLKIFLAGLKTEPVERAILQAGVKRRLHSFAKKEWIEKNYIPLYRQLRAPLAGSPA